MNTCPKCNWDNKDDATKCTLCAADLQAVSVTASAQPPIAPVMGQTITPTYQAPPTVGVTANVSVYDTVIKSGGNWFYWIAGLSLINTVIALSGGSMSFVVGLGITQALDAIAKEFGRAASMIVVPMNLIIAGIYIMFGYFACRRARWAFITGIVFYSLDTILMLAVREWFSVAFHAFALFSISRGLKAASAVRQAEAIRGPGL